VNTAWNAAKTIKTENVSNLKRESAMILSGMWEEQAGDPKAVVQ
jgi:hypothetical protein